jgi:hypothetical protein
LPRDFATLIFARLRQAGWALSLWPHARMKIDDKD